MANLFSSGLHKVIPEFTGLQVNTSVQVLPIPIIYGSPRVPINLIYYNGFSAQIVNQGGKGILTGGKGSETVEYFASILMAIGEGPIGAPLIIYQDQEVWTPATFPTNGASYFNGTTTQTAVGFVLATWPKDARNYRNIAYYAFDQAQLDSSATVPQINLVIEGFLRGTSPLNNSIITIATGQYDPSGNPISFIGNIPIGDADADPALVVYDFLTDPTHGAGFPPAWIDTSTLYTSANGFDANTGDTALSTFCQAVGLAWSVALNNAESANSILERWMKNLNVAIVWNGAQLKFIPYWDAYAGGNPGWDATNGIAKKYYTPYTVPIVQITMDQILQSDKKDEHPIMFSRKDPLEVYNTVRLDFNDRNNFFNNVPVEYKDEAHIELYGPRVDNIGLADEFTLRQYCEVATTILLRRNIGIMRNFIWKMGPLWSWLDPMDIVQIPDPVNYANSIVVRIVSVEDDEDENVSIVAEEYPVGVQSPTIIPTTATTPPNSGATNIPPALIFPPVMFAPTTDMLTATGFATPQWVFGCSAGYYGEFDQNWGGVNIWISLDEVNYTQLGTLIGPSTIGSLSSPITAYGGVNPDNADTLTVNLSECGRALASFSPIAASTGASICILADPSSFELIAYTTATLVGPHTYDLTGLYRGLYGTASRLFSAGSQFMFVAHTANIFETSLPPAYVGHMFWVKAQGFNVFHRAVQDLSEVVAYPYLATGPTPGPQVPPQGRLATYRRLTRPEADAVLKQKKTGGRVL